MILEGKKLTAFDAMEAAMRLSDMYMVFNQKESISFRYSHELEQVCFTFGKWRGFDFEITKMFKVSVNDTNIGDTFSDVFLAIEKELDRLEKFKKEKTKHEIQST